MKIKNLRYLAMALVSVAFIACEKEPSTSDLHKDYLVYTAYDTTADFSTFETYFVPDEILVIGKGDKPEYRTDDAAKQIIATVVDRMNQYGYTRTDDKQTADLGLQLSYVEEVTYFVGSNAPYWWWDYPYYWTPGYWGDWLDWYYPYKVYYGYTAGSLLTEMVDLTSDDQVRTTELPILWNSFVSGLLTGNDELNLQRTLEAVNQAFDQSSYLNKQSNR